MCLVFITVICFFVAMYIVTVARITCTVLVETLNPAQSINV